VILQGTPKPYRSTNCGKFGPRRRGRGFEQATQSPEKDEVKHFNGEAPLPAVSPNTLARCLGVSPKVIYDLAKGGIIERSSAKLFPLEDSVRRYCEHLRRQMSGST
jgi:hypothetical protein